MATKLPKEMLEKHDIEASIPAPTIETVAAKDGSFKLYANYDATLIEKFARDLAQEISERFDDEVLEELMKLNGYVPERTCTMRFYPTSNLWRCSECVGATHAERTDDEPPMYCQWCGARVKEEE